MGRYIHLMRVALVSGVTCLASVVWLSGQDYYSVSLTAGAGSLIDHSLPSDISSRWQAEYRWIDVGVGRSFDIDKRFEPMIGLRAAMMQYIDGDIGLGLPDHTSYYLSIVYGASISLDGMINRLSLSGVMAHHRLLAAERSYDEQRVFFSNVEMGIHYDFTDRLRGGVVVPISLYAPYLTHISQLEDDGSRSYDVVKSRMLGAQLSLRYRW